jgi:hypothetical protein
VLTDLLRVSGPPLFDYFASLDLMAIGGGVSWAGLEQAPIWLDVAREYTERWLHQQHIRDAVGKPALTDRRFLGPVLAAFVYSLPHAFRETKAEPGTTVQLHISGDAGGDWSLRREAQGWILYSGEPATPFASVQMDQDTAWRVFTKGLSPAHAESLVSFNGDSALGKQVLQAVAIIA